MVDPKQQFFLGHRGHWMQWKATEAMSAAIRCRSDCATDIFCFMRFVSGGETLAVRAVRTLGDCTETLLAGSIPDLELNVLVIQHDGPYLEVNANGREVILRKAAVVVSKASHDAALANATVANERGLEHVVGRPSWVRMCLHGVCSDGVWKARMALAKPKLVQPRRAFGG